MSLGPTHWLRIKLANSLEFFTLYEFFKRGETILHKNLERLEVGEFTNDTMGLSGKLALCILGKP